MKPIVIYSLLALLIILNPTANGLGNVLYGGEILKTGEYLSYKTYSFVCQTDCNLVLYESGKPVWASNTGGLSRNCYCTLQKDGNLVVYRPNGSALWASKSWGATANYVLVLQDDRNVVIYGPAKWATNTNVRGSGVTITRLGGNNGTVNGISGRGEVEAGAGASNGSVVG